MTPPAEPSPLHTLCRIRVGEASPLFYPADQCTGIGLFDLVAMGLITTAGLSLLGIGSGSSLYLLGLLVIIPGLVLWHEADRFTSRERLARAQKRRAAVTEPT